MKPSESNHMSVLRGLRYCVGRSGRCRRSKPRLRWRMIRRWKILTLRRSEPLKLADSESLRSMKGIQIGTEVVAECFEIELRIGEGGDEFEIKFCQYSTRSTVRILGRWEHSRKDTAPRHDWLDESWRWRTESAWSSKLKSFYSEFQSDYFCLLPFIFLHLIRIYD